MLPIGLIYRVIGIGNCLDTADFSDYEEHLIAPSWKVYKYPSF
jgi:hypothetical protein